MTESILSKVTEEICAFNNSVKNSIKLTGIFPKVALQYPVLLVFTILENSGDKVYCGVSVYANRFTTEQLL